MNTQSNNHQFTILSPTKWNVYLLCVFSLILLGCFEIVHAQTSYRLSHGGYNRTTVEEPPESFNAGFSFYSAAWPLLGEYPRNNTVQTGLYATWLWPTGLIHDSQTGHYTTIEGGLGWWGDRHFQTATPKYITGGVSWGWGAWWFANGPGSGTAAGGGKYAVAQLSSSLLFPPDGINLRQGTNGELFGYGHLALPLAEAKATTAGVAVPTGEKCWTLFLNTTNFKGPLTFFTPFFWSQPSLYKPECIGAGFDTRWCSSEKAIQMETQETVQAAGVDIGGRSYSKSIPVSYPVDSSGYSLIMHRSCVYNQDAIWNDVTQWLAGNSAVPNKIFSEASTFLQKVEGENPLWDMKNQSNSFLGKLNWDGIVNAYTPDEKEWGYQWNTAKLAQTPSTEGSLVKLPEYYTRQASATGTSTWSPIKEVDLPPAAASILANVDLGNQKLPVSLVLVDDDPAWTSPGPSSGPYRALLGDGSFVTYYWYRFADQPALMKADMTLAERNRMQIIAEKIHRDLRNDHDYLAPPTTGKLAELDPGQLVTPPVGLEYGYVPIAWRQDWGGSATKTGSLAFTGVPATSAVTSPFDVTVRAVDTAGADQVVTVDTLIQLSVASGNGMLKGVIEGIIRSNTSSVTITGVTYSAADSMTLTASATCLAPVNSNTIFFTNPKGQVNIYNKPASSITSNQVKVNGTLGCFGTDANVQLYWGRYNGGITPARWANSVSIGNWNNETSKDMSRDLTGLLPDTTYYYCFRASNAAGVKWASKFQSFRTLPVIPTITAQPVSATWISGDPVQVSVAALNAANYQWYKGAIALTDGGRFSGVNTATLKVSGVISEDAGTYTVRLTNPGGQVTSNTATFVVVAPTNLTWDANGIGSGVTDGGGQWSEKLWWNATANVNWVNGNNAKIGMGGTGGVISLGAARVNNLDLSNFSGNYLISGGELTVTNALNFNASGSADISSVISGSGSLTKNGSGTLTVYGFSNNTYSGGTVINSGQFNWGTFIDGISPPCGNACGSGPVTLNGAAKIMFGNANISNALTLNGGNLGGDNGWGATWSGPITVNSTTSLTHDYGLNLTGPIRGPGGFIKTGQGLVTFSGMNSYEGDTVIERNQVAWSSASAVAPGRLVIKSGTVANLAYVGNSLVKGLTLGGAVMPAGTYGSATSAAAGTFSNFFSGPGTVTVPGPTTVTLALTAGTSSAIENSLLTFTASVTSPTSSGSVKFFDGSSEIGSVSRNGASQVSLSVSNLSIGNHTIKAEYALGVSNSIVINITENSGLVPTGLVATTSNNAVSLKWSSCVGATSYTVKRARTASGPFMNLDTKVGLQYDDLTVSNDRIYYYVVSSITGTVERHDSLPLKVVVGYSALPITSGLVLRMDASKVVGNADGSQLNTWSDESGSGNDAIRQRESSSGYPKYVANGINGRPVIRFDSANSNTGDYFKFNRIANIRTVFWVIKENAGLSDGRFLLGDSVGYDFHRSTANGALWAGGLASSNITNGITKLMGNEVNGASTALPPASFQVVSLVTTGNVQADQICQDRTFHGSWQGDIAEILIYDRPLSADEENQVGTYLGSKYGLITSYNALPVASGLALRMDASQISGTASGAQLNTWADTSGLANDAIRQNGSSSGYPKYISAGINGKPVVRFNSSNNAAGDYFKFNRISNIRTVFWVLKENAGVADYHSLLGDSLTYEFHRGVTPNGPLWDATWASSSIRGGATKLMGNLIDGTTTSLPSESFQLVSLVTTGNVSANQICQDRTSHGSWQGDIAEILVYDRALSASEELSVGSYLGAKYSLAVGYPSVLGPNSVVALPSTSGTIGVRWAPLLGAVNYTVSSRNTQTGLEQFAFSTVPNCLVTGLTDGIPYEFKVSATYPSWNVSNYSPVVTSTPRTVLSFATWVSLDAQGLTGSVSKGPTDDPDHDGIPNLVEFALGGEPMKAKTGILPVLSNQTGPLIFEYDRSDASLGGTNQAVEYGNNLTGWISIPIFEASSEFVDITPGILSDRVRVTIPVTGPKIFVRLKVSE